MPYLAGIIVGAFVSYWVYQRASERKAEFGWPPWHWPIVVWTIAAFLLALPVALLYLIAAWRQRRRYEKRLPRTSEDPELTQEFWRHK